MLASGNVPVRYLKLPGGFKGTDETVRIMSDLATGKWGSRSPKIRALARNILQKAGVREKDYTGEAIALGTWVRDHIRYMRDPYGQETVSPPEEIAFNMRAGDCDDQSVLLSALLGSVGIPSRFKVIGVTPFQYSHVYLQAKPRDAWITMDPIMRDKPIGWEVPIQQRQIEKTYPINGPADAGIEGATMLGYIEEPRTEGSGAGRPHYVTMKSMLDNDSPINAIMAFPPNQNIPQIYPTQRARSIAPVLRSIQSADRTQGNTPAGMGRHEVIGPDAMAGMSVVKDINSQVVPAYMQTKTLAQVPEGADLMFSRAAQVLNPRRGDTVEYYGEENLAEKPTILPYTDVAGMDENFLAGVGMVGPGMGAGSSGRTVRYLAGDEIPEGAPPVVAAAPSSKGIATLAAVGLLTWLVLRKKRR